MVVKRQGQTTGNPGKGYLPFQSDKGIRKTNIKQFKYVGMESKLMEGGIYALY